MTTTTAPARTPADALRALQQPQELAAIATDLRQQAEALPAGTMGRDDLLVAAGCVQALADLWAARPDAQFHHWRVVTDTGVHVPGAPVPYTLLPVSNFDGRIAPRDMQSLPQALAHWLDPRAC